jgi:catechol 2,3-dioxygenase-like lactoylglutathione lyase family enzyme
VVGGLIGAVHLTLFSTDAEATRAFFRDVLGLDSVDAGGGWPVFALPPAELGMYLMCDDIEATVARLEEKGVPLATPVSDEGWGLVAHLAVPGLGRLGIYEPRHPSPLRS